MCDNSWVFDSLICYLHGPVWNAPLQTFIEEKSLIFNANDDPDPTNPEYIQIYNDYKNLVDYMLGSFMEEMEISPEQFENACLEGRNQEGAENPFSFHQGLFQQIWAANDIKIFIKMMIQRNVEIQLQALDLIECNQQLNSVEDKIDLPGAKIIGDSIIKEMPELEKKTEKTFENKEKQTIDQSANKIDRLNLFFEQQEISPEELQKRQEYLRAQRDKILEIKKNVRAKNLNESIAKRIERPSSSSVKIAQKYLNGVNDENLPVSNEQSTSFQLRKTLAKRLRSEVVENN